MTHSVLLGLAGGALTIAYLFVVEGGIHLMWAETDQVGWFSGSWQILVIPVAAGLVVGLLYKAPRLPPRFKGFIDELEDGEVEPKTAPGAVLVAVVSLIGGASLGPEAPLGTGAGALGTWLARRNGGDEASIRSTTFAGMSAAFGGLVSSPIGGPLLAFELEHEQTTSYYFHQLIPGIVAGAVGFGVVWPVLGAPIIGLYDVTRTDFRPWMLIAAAGIGLAGAAVALLLGGVLVPIATLMRRLDDRPLIRGLIGGIGVAATGFLLPLTMFSGQSGLAVVLDDPAALGWLMLMALIAVKTVALGISLGGGFYGGPIFPFFFIGGVFGALLHVVFPGLSLGLAVGCAMAAIGAATALIPLSLTVLASLMVHADFLVAGAIMISASVGFVVRYLVSQQNQVSDVQAAAAA